MSAISLHRPVYYTVHSWYDKSCHVGGLLHGASNQGEFVTLSDIVHWSRPILLLGKSVI